MIKSVLIGIWICCVTLGACYAGMQWQATHVPKQEDEKFFGRMQQIKTKMISVPVVQEGVVQGYVVAQFAFNVEATLLKKLSVKPESFLLDEAFREIYTGDVLELRRMKKTDLPAMAKRIAENVNKRFGSNFVDDVLIEELNFVPKEQSRAGTRQ